MADSGRYLDPTSAVPANIVVDLRRRYSEPQRAYHDWRHVEELLALHGEVYPRLHDAKAVLFALLFHDVVYDPARDDNEERSADLMRMMAAGALGSRSMARAARLIEATKGHQKRENLATPDDSDTAFFIDMDLAILGAPPARFDQYERQIRLEYAHLSDDRFMSGRSRFLRQLLGRDPLYLSAWGRDRFGLQAVHNLRRGLATLEASQARIPNPQEIEGD